MFNIKKEYLIIVSTVLLVGFIYWLKDDPSERIIKNPVPTEFVEKKLDSYRIKVCKLVT